MTHWTREDVIRKVQSLLRLAGDNPSEGEIKVAMGKVQDLLEKHNLSMSEVDIEKEVESISTKKTSPMPRTYQWVWSLANAVELLTSTQSFRRREWYDGHRNRQPVIVFCGTVTDTTTATALFEYLYATVMAMGAKQSFVNRRGRNSYRIGIGQRLLERAKSLQETSQEDPYKAPTGGESYMPLVHLKEEAIKNHLLQNFNIKKTWARAHIGDLGALAQGYRDGGKVSLTSKKELSE